MCRITSVRYTVCIYTGSSGGRNCNTGGALPKDSFSRDRQLVPWSRQATLIFILLYLSCRVHASFHCILLVSLSFIFFLVILPTHTHLLLYLAFTHSRCFIHLSHHTPLHVATPATRYTLLFHFGTHFRPREFHFINRVASVCQI